MSNSGIINANNFNDVDFNAVESLITVDDLKKRYLFGADLTDDDGNELPEEVLQFYINAAISLLEHKLDICIRKRTFVEKRDYRRADYQNWNFLRLYHFPVLELKSFKAQFPLGTDAVEFPEEWYRLYEESGEVQLVPSHGTVANFPISQGGYFLPQVWSGVKLPQFFILEYVAGFEDDCIPHIFNHAIGLIASIGIFDIIGDLINGAGIAATSLGIDGLSQSISTTSSATNAGYGARILSYKDHLKDIMTTLRHYYKGINLAVT